MADENLSNPINPATGQPYGWRTRIKAPQIRVTIDQDTISDSVERSSSHCMIAEAIKRAAPQFGGVSVDLTSIRFTDKERHLRFVYITPRVAQIALIDFDRGIMPKPFSFLLKTPAQIVRSNPTRDGSKRIKRYEGDANRAAHAASLRRSDGIVDHDESNGGNRMEVTRVVAAMDNPAVAIGPPTPIALKQGAARKSTTTATLVGGSPPPPGNLAKMRRFGLRQLRE